MKDKTKDKKKRIGIVGIACPNATIKKDYLYITL